LEENNNPQVQFERFDYIIGDIEEKQMYLNKLLKEGGRFGFVKEIELQL
jgi:hypothetical protein